MKDVRASGLEESFQDTRQLIRSIVWNFMRTYGLKSKQFPELEAEAALLFIKAYDSYDPDRHHKFSTHLTKVIVNGLIDNLRSHNRYHRSKIDGNYYLALSRHRHPLHRLERMLRDLEGGGQQVLILFLDSPGNFRQHMEKARSKRKLLVEYLKTNFHWSDDKIQQAMDDLKEALED